MEGLAPPQAATDSSDARRKAAAAWAACLLVLPWLWPFASGPSASVVPWLAGASCAAIVALFTGAGFSRPFAAAVVVFLPLAAWRAVSALEPAALGGALLVIALAAGVGAKLARDGGTAVIARAWWIAAAISTVLALLQYFALAGALSPWVSSTDAGTAYANLRQRNQFASLTALGFAALLWEARRGARLAWLAPVAVALGLGNAASVSRTGLVEFVVLAVLAVLWPGRSRRQAQVAAGALAAYGVGVVLLPILLAAVTGSAGEDLWHRVSNPDSCMGRSALWSNVLHLIAQRPWLGWGWGELDYGHYMTLYPGARFCDILDNAHNLPLHIAVEFGVPVAAVVIGLVAWAVLRGRPWREADTDRQLAWAALAVIAVHSMLEYPLWYAPFQLAGGLAIGLLWPAAVAEPKHPAARALLPGLLVAAIAYAVWDYGRVTQVYLAPEDRLPAWREDPLAASRNSFLFGEHARFAELTLTPLTRANAAWTLARGQEMLHYSPEPRVIEKVVESALLENRNDIAARQIARFRVAFPREHREWLAEQADLKPRRGASRVKD